MSVHIKELKSTVEVDGEREHTVAAEPSTLDEVTQRARDERAKRDRERLHAEGYAD